MARDLRGSVCIHVSGNGVSGARSDLLLQCRAGVPAEFVEDMRSRFHLPAGYFSPALFDPTFGPKGYEQFGAFPKSVIVLSILPDLTRTMYRHRETGLLVDPGTAWLNSRLSRALADLSFLKWFRETFESLGRMSVDEFKRTYRSLIPAITEATGARVLVFNALELDPLDKTYDFSESSPEAVTRRRRFNLALFELARELRFDVVDVDSIAKLDGIDQQVDFSHLPVERMRTVGVEVARILSERGAA
jgi:hypothetical protein